MTCKYSQVYVPENERVMALARGAPRALPSADALCSATPLWTAACTRIAESSAFRTASVAPSPVYVHLSAYQFACAKWLAVRSASPRRGTSTADVVPQRPACQEHQLDDSSSRRHSAAPSRSSGHHRRRGSGRATLEP